MFTGLIQAIGCLVAREQQDGDQRLRFTIGTLPFGDAKAGESIACNGVCLTAVAFGTAHFDADVSTETLALSTLGSLPLGSAINLERALRLGDRLDGHLVSGHIDGVGSVESVHHEARGQRWRFSAPRPLLRFIAAKGSVAVDGTSLTVNAVDDHGFEVMLVPHTLAHTGFGTMAPKTRVNLEIDTLARYVARWQDTGDWA